MPFPQAPRTKSILSAQLIALVPVDAGGVVVRVVVAVVALVVVVGTGATAPQTCSSGLSRRQDRTAAHGTHVVNKLGTIIRILPKHQPNQNYQRST